MASSLKVEKPFSSTFWKELAQTWQNYSVLRSVADLVHRGTDTSNHTSLEEVSTLLRHQREELEQMLAKELVRVTRTDSTEVN